MKALHRFASALAVCTLGLIFVGGLVTSTRSGLAVPDWPLSYGRFFPPMVGGILFEHGHRMVAATVGFLTVLLAISMTIWADRAWLKKAAWGAVGLVVLQGVLGGVTVLFRLPKPISIAHAFTAQTFFCLVVSIAVWTSPRWASATTRTEPANRVPVHRLAVALVGTAFVQLLLGAILRHTGRVLPLHVGGAAMLMILTFALTRRVWTDHPDRNGLCGLTLALSGVLMTQIGLGIGSYLILIHHFATIPPPFYAPAFITAHVATGALFLGLSMILALVSYRTRPAATPPIQTTFADYFTLTKPGISFMAGITALAGFVLGSAGDVHFARLINTCVGVLLAAGGAGTLNMLIERDIDGRMKRTQNRPLPSGRLNPGEVLFLGVLMSTVGVAYLSWTVNALAAVLTGVTVSVYLYVYTPLKKISTACVTVGAVAGALPPVVGWAAATGKIGFEALALFGIVFFWQYPHFLSLAWLYKEDYERGGLHVVSPEERSTAMSVLLTSVGLLVVSVAPSLLNLTGRIYFVAAAACGGAMLVYAIRFFAEPSRIHAKKIFLFSLAYVPLLVVLMLLNGPSGVWTY